jgi:hypothetical protein
MVTVILLPVLPAMTKKGGIAMLVPANRRSTSPKPVEEILLGYLHLAWPWPGGDGLTTNDMLSCYRTAAANGFVPDWAQLCYLHPRRVAELKSLWQNQGWQMTWATQAH